VTRRWVEAPRLAKETVAVVSEALVPMFLWPWVPVVKRIPDRLTSLERIACEAALQLLPVRPEDLVELTDVPRDVVDRVLARLVAADVLERGGDGEDHLPTEATVVVLAEQEVVRHEVTRCGFVFLPVTDELLAFPGGVPAWGRARPAGHWPMPDDLAGTARATLIHGRIAAGLVRGLPDDIVGAAAGPDQPDDAVPDTCPAYRCRGRAVADGDATTVRLEVFPDPAALSRPVGGQLPGAGGLAEHWRGSAGQVAAAVREWPGEVTVEPDGPCSWRLALSAPAALAAAEELADAGLVLTRPAALSLAAEDHIATAVVRFIPRDAQAMTVFAVEHAAQTVIREPDLASLGDTALHQALAGARAAYPDAGNGLTPAAVEARIWRLGHYQHLYALRRERDFSYD